MVAKITRKDGIEYTPLNKILWSELTFFQMAFIYDQSLVGKFNINN